MFVNDINPVLYKMGIFEIRYYGIIYALGFIITYFFIRYHIKKGQIENLNEKNLDSLIIYLIIGVVLGARIFEFVFYSPATFWTDPLEILKTWHGGLSFHGGLIGAIIAIWIFSLKHKIKVMQLFDLCVIPAALGIALGRIANFTNQELYGFPSKLPWCVVYTSVDNVCRHPYQVYASLSHFILFGILLYVYARQKIEGSTFWSFVFFYGSFRLITDIWRYEDKVLFGLSVGQILSLMMAVTAGTVLILRRVKKRGVKGI